MGYTIKCECDVQAGYKQQKNLYRFRLVHARNISDTIRKKEKEINKENTLMKILQPFPIF